MLLHMNLIVLRIGYTLLFSLMLFDENFYYKLPYYPRWLNTSLLLITYISAYCLFDYESS